MSRQARPMSSLFGRGGEVVRRRWVLIGLGLAAVGGAAWFWFARVEPFLGHYRWSRRVEHDIKQLAHKRPPDVTKGPWEFMVGWTINLHGNCGVIPDRGNRAWRDGFAAELERRLAGPLSLADVEWVWDEYARHTRSGQLYSDNCRPTQAEGFPQAREGCFGMPVE